MTIDWIDPDGLRQLVIGIIVAAIGSSIRAFSIGEKAKPFLVRLIMGVLMGAVIAYALRTDKSVDERIKIFIDFASGFVTTEVARKISNWGERDVKTDSKEEK